MDRKGSMVV